MLDCWLVPQALGNSYLLPGVSKWLWSPNTLLKPSFHLSPICLSVLKKKIFWTLWYWFLPYLAALLIVMIFDKKNSCGRSRKWPMCGKVEVNGQRLCVMEASNFYIFRGDITDFIPPGHFPWLRPGVIWHSGHNLSTNHQLHILTKAPPPVFTPHRLNHHKPACQSSHSALLNLQKAGVVKYLQAFSGFMKQRWESAVMLSSQQLQSAASFRRDWESNAAYLLRFATESVSWTCFIHG